MTSSRSKTRAVLFFVFLVVCLIQCYSIMVSYFQYPIVVDMYDVSPNLGAILPGVTICNNNRLSLKGLMGRNQALERAIADKFPEWFHKQQPQIGAKSFNYFRDEISNIYQRFNYTAQTEIDNSTLAELIEMSPKSGTFIKYLSCAQAWPDSVHCGDIGRVESIQDRRCTTLLHKGALAYDHKNRPHLFTQIPDNQTFDLPFGYFDARDVVKMIVNFDPEDYADLKRQVGARIVFHSNTFVASFNELDFFITRGYRYDFNINREVMLLLDKPYGRCWDYEDKNLHKFDQFVNPRVPLDVNTCFQNCVITNIASRLDCWPGIMPYFLADTLDPFKKYKACRWVRDLRYTSLYKEMLRVIRLKNRRKQGQQQQQNQTQEQERNQDNSDNKESKNHMRLFKKVRKHCWRKCMFGCKLTRYTVSVSKTVWPTDLRISLDKTGRHLRLRHCCALLTVKYPHFHHSVQQSIPKYNLIDTIGNVGGLLAVWMGLSVVSVYHATQKLIEFCNRRAASRRRVDSLCSLPDSSRLKALY